MPHSNIMTFHLGPSALGHMRVAVLVHACGHVKETVAHRPAFYRRSSSGLSRYDGSGPGAALLLNPLEPVGHLFPSVGSFGGSGADIGERRSLSFDAGGLSVLAIRIEYVCFI